jgi:hypothetical protein
MTGEKSEPFESHVRHDRFNKTWTDFFFNYEPLLVFNITFYHEIISKSCLTSWTFLRVFINIFETITLKHTNFHIHKIF